MSPKYFYLIIAIVGFVNANPFDQPLEYEADSRQINVASDNLDAPPDLPLFAKYQNPLVNLANKKDTNVNVNDYRNDPNSQLQSIQDRKNNPINFGNEDNESKLDVAPKHLNFPESKNPSLDLVNEKDSNSNIYDYESNANSQLQSIQNQKNKLGKLRSQESDSKQVVGSGILDQASKISKASKFKNPSLDLVNEKDSNLEINNHQSNANSQLQSIQNQKNKLSKLINGESDSKQVEGSETLDHASNILKASKFKSPSHGLVNEKDSNLNINDYQSNSNLQLQSIQDRKNKLSKLRNKNTDSTLDAALKSRHHSSKLLKASKLKNPSLHLLNEKDSNLNINDYQSNSNLQLQNIQDRKKKLSKLKIKDSDSTVDVVLNSRHKPSKKVSHLSKFRNPLKHSTNEEKNFNLNNNQNNQHFKLKHPNLNKHKTNNIKKEASDLMIKLDGVKTKNERDREIFNYIKGEPHNDCPNTRNKNHFTEIFAPNISSLPLEEDLKVGHDPESSKSSKIYVGEDVTICWTEITTIKENKLLAPPNLLVIREYAISFENAATIPDEYLECSKMDGEISDDRRTVCDSNFPSVIDQDTRKSRVINTTTVSREGNLDITQIKLIKCGVGSLVTRDVFKTGKENTGKRIEIKVSPLTKSVEDYCHTEAEDEPKFNMRKVEQPEYNDDDEDGVLSTGIQANIFSTTPQSIAQDLLESSENTSCSGLHCPLNSDNLNKHTKIDMEILDKEKNSFEEKSSVKIDSTTATIETSLINDVNLVANISFSTEHELTSTSAPITPETVIKTVDLGPSNLNVLVGHDLKLGSTNVEEKTTKIVDHNDQNLQLKSTLKTDDLDEDYSGSGSGDCSEEVETEGPITLEPNDDNYDIKIRNNTSIHIVEDSLTTTTTDATPIDVERKLHEISTTSETRKSTMPINSLVIETPDKNGKHRLALKIRVSLEEIDNNEPHRIADIEKNLTLDERLTEHGNHSLLQQLQALNNSGDSLEAIKEILNCSLLDKISDDVINNPGRIQRRSADNEKSEVIKECLPEIHEDVKTGLHNVLSKVPSLDSSNDNKNNNTNVNVNTNTSTAHKSKRSVDEGVEELSRWSNERFMKLQTGGQLHSITELTVLRNTNDDC
ncbi:uncharacterized protein LOC130677643 [Microplitis mediator]|uniref:uncharacterized protein LOC130677643 n=1 Tax=Microplitis mediator TaxID=375433 RepID=UPI002557A3B3|nr:uncharacterized protein LOC130677643 [Microplitis mediator]XP_057340453.1 uncharacterized protein LOC130677643 [Microplitis mediator]